jgi:hypothetical protein
MALAFYFRPTGFTPAKYDEAIKQLEAAGAGNPPGRQYHTAFESDGLIEVFDIWESQETSEAFGSILMPILQGLGVDPGQPSVAPIHNIIQG